MKALYFDLWTKKLLLEKYLEKNSKSKEFLMKAINNSATDLQFDVEKILDSKKSFADFSIHSLNLIKDILGSSIWVTHSYYRYLTSFMDLPDWAPSFMGDAKHQKIIDHIAHKRSTKDLPYSFNEMFIAVFNELSFVHVDPHYQSPLKFPKVKITIVLVSGALNELYKTASFQRGVEHLSKTYNIKFLITKVPGLKSAKHNSIKLARQLKKYIKENPNEKLWLLTYSKGGVDSLHFLNTNKNFSDKYICGLSTIASPILGTPHTDIAPVKFLYDHVFNSQLFQEIIDKGRDLFASEAKKSVSEKYQSQWFVRNHKELPKKPFYSSIAFNSSWYETHYSMALTKLLFFSKEIRENDGLVSAKNAQFPDFFKSINFGVMKGHHLVCARSSTFNQEALIEAHIIMLNYLGVLK